MRMRWRVCVHALALSGSKAQSAFAPGDRPALPACCLPYVDIGMAAPAALPCIGKEDSFSHSYHQTRAGAHMGPVSGIDLLDKSRTGFLCRRDKVEKWVLTPLARQSYDCLNKANGSYMNLKGEKENET